MSQVRSYFSHQCYRDAAKLNNLALQNFKKIVFFIFFSHKIFEYSCLSINLNNDNTNEKVLNNVKIQGKLFLCRKARHH